MIITDPANRTESHAIQLALKLLDLGLLRRGEFNFVLFMHDDHCKALRTNSPMDCRCDPETIIGGKVYVYSEVMGRVQ